MVMHERRLLCALLAALLSCVGGCEDKCASLEPQAQIDIELDFATSHVHRLEVVVDLEGSDDARSWSMLAQDLGLQGEERRGSVRILFSNALTHARKIRIKVSTFDADDRLSGYGENHPDDTAMPNGCNFLRVRVDGKGRDGGVEAGAEPQNIATVANLTVSSKETPRAAAVCELLADSKGKELVLGFPDGLPNNGPGKVLVVSLDGLDDKSALDLEADKSAVKLQISGYAPGEGFGSTLSCADTNNDGLDDLIVGAPKAEGGAGRAYLFRGSASSAPTIDLALEHDAASLLVLGDPDAQVGTSFAAGYGWDSATPERPALVFGGPGDDNGRGTILALFPGTKTDKSGAVVYLHGRTQEVLPSSSPGLGTTIATDGTHVVVGVPTANGGQGAAWVFSRTGDNWTGNALTPGQRNLGSKAAFGSAVAISAVNGVMVGAPGDNHVHLFNTSTQVHTGTISAPGGFSSGFGAVLAATAIQLLACAPNAGCVLHELPYSASSTPLRFDVPTGNYTAASYGSSAALNDGYVVIGAPDGQKNGESQAGLAFLYKLAGPTAPAPTVLSLSNSSAAGQDRFGTAVALRDDSGQGVLVAVGAPRGGTDRAGVVTVFTGDGSVHATLGDQAPAEARFGSSLAWLSDGLVVGAPGPEAATALVSEPGAVHGFSWPEGEGAKRRWILRSWPPRKLDRFGAALGVAPKQNLDQVLVAAGAPGYEGGQGRALTFAPMTAAQHGRVVGDTHDRLGETLAAGRIRGRAHPADLVAGAPGSDAIVLWRGEEFINTPRVLRHVAHEDYTRRYVGNEGDLGAGLIIGAVGRSANDKRTSDLDHSAADIVVGSPTQLNDGRAYLLYGHKFIHGESTAVQDVAVTTGSSAIFESYDRSGALGRRLALLPAHVDGTVEAPALLALATDCGDGNEGCVYLVDASQGSEKLETVMLGEVGPHVVARYKGDEAQSRLGAAMATGQLLGGDAADLVLVAPDPRKIYIIQR